ncbi:uncharacterized protein LOC119727091 [Patiria miniata]|uniref:HAT C-terminal dimerisation domain-containing protein n=1 Tax=Patiria miniata TaxID=46514 RepID=A0A913ZT02_PATMI|nr:uncharacterized protein LOC119727091 [Patiria miniata]
MANFEFAAAVIIMGEVHKRLERTFQLFQNRDLFFQRVDKEVSSTISSIKRLPTRPMLKTELVDWLEQGKLHESGIVFSEEKWKDFIDQVATPFVDSVAANIKRRLPDSKDLECFKIFDPVQAAEHSNDPEYGFQEIETLATRLLSRAKAPGSHKEVTTAATNEWESFSYSLTSAEFEHKSVEQVLQKLVKEGMYDLYPSLSTMAATALTVPVSTAEVESLFSTMKRVRTPLRNRLQRENLSTCIRLSGFSPKPRTVNFGEMVRVFYTKNPNRRVECSDNKCDICGGI